MQREVKKPELPVKPAIKVEKTVSSKVSSQEKAVSPKKKSVIIAEKIIKKPDIKIPRKIIALVPKDQKASSAPQVVKAVKRKITKPIAAEKSTPKTKTAKIEPVIKKSKSANVVVEKKIETVITSITKNPVKKKIKPIGSAVVRGKSGRYDFEMFPIDAEIKDGSAIYVISKRITDQRGRGHHKFVCIGQTESLLGELKKHQKEKCIKQHKANVICLLREESETSRLKIETDLRQAHMIFCNQQ